MFNQIIERPAALTGEQINVIENIVLTNDIPWYFNEHSVFGDNIGYFSHTLICRPEDTKKIKNNSPLTEFFIELFKSIALANNIHVCEVLRSSLNSSFHHPLDHGTIHTDHEYHHNNFIMYLTSLDNSGTIIFDADKKTKKYISGCVRYQYLFFPGLYHAQMYPPIGTRRTVFVVTFK